MVTIMAEEPLTFFKETFVPYIGANAFLEATFHSFELVSMISRVSELESAWPSATLMTAKEMLKFGYQFGQGLDAVGHGKASLIELPDNKGGFGLGYDPFDEEIFQASKGKKRKCLGPHHVRKNQIWFVLSTFAQRILSECHHIPRG